MVIDSPKNPRVKEWRRLHLPKGRRETGLALVEGPHLVAAALAAGVEIEEVIAESGRENSPELRLWRGAVTLVSRRVMEALGETDTPQCLAAVVRMPRAGRLAPRTGRWLLVDGVQDPGNLGTMIRTADAAGLGGVVLGEGTADAWSGKALRAAQGSTFHLAIESGAALEEWIEELRGAGVTIFGSGAGAGSIDYREAPAPGAPGFALLVGNEGAGVRAELLAQCDAVLRVPLRGRAESLGVAVAAGVLMYALTGGTE